MIPEARVVRAYRRLLRLLPRPVRERHAEEMVAVFAAMWADAAGLRRRLRVFSRCFSRLPLVAVAEWWDHLKSAPGVRHFRREGRVVDAITSSVRWGTRALSRAPAFTLTTVLLLGLGVGAVTTIFTVVDHIFLRNLPYPSAERLVLVEGSQSYPAFQDFQAMRSVEGWAAASVDDVTLTGVGDPARLRQARVTDGFFTFFGARPALGRLLLPRDYDVADVVVLSDGAWDRIWGRDPGVLGRTVRIEGAPVLVAGVLDASFSPPEPLLEGRPADVWRPVDRADPDFEERASRSLVAAGRLAPGATLEEARREATELAERRALGFPRIYIRADGSRVELPIVTLHEGTVGRAREGVYLLLGAVGLLLLVACANVAQLFTVRGLGRSREMAVCRALGAATPALAGRLAVESLLVAAGGTLVALILARWGLEAWLALTPDAIPRAGAVRLDGRVLAFAAGLATLASLAFGVLPTLRVARMDPGHALRGAGRHASGYRGARTLRSGLVAAEVALSLVLVSAAGLLLKSYRNLHDRPLGFRTEEVWTLPIRHLAGAEEPAQWIQRLDGIGDALREVPGVRSATYGLSVPLEHPGGNCCWSRTLSGVDAGGSVEVTIHPFGADYFDVFEPQILAGRAWTPGEEGMTPPAILLNETLALALFGSVREAVGQEVAVGEGGHVVLGVVAEDRHYGPHREHGAAAYVPIGSVPFVPNRATLAVRMEPGAGDLARRLQEAVWTVEPDLAVPLVRSMDEWASRATARTRFESLLFVVFAAVGLLLAAGGLYGTLLYVVGMERRELGIRLALGAKSRDLGARVLSRGLAAAGVGAVVGAAGALASWRLLRNRLFGVESGDPATLAASIAVLLASAAAASWIPARRAAAIDPLETLREE